MTEGVPLLFDPTPVARRLRALRRGRRITPHQHAVADALLWSARAPGRDQAQVSITRLAALAGVGRTATVAALKRLRDLGVLSWRQTRLRVAWGFGVASRQWRNVYRLFAGGTESAARPADREPARKEAGIEVVRLESAGHQAARTALDRIRERRQTTLGLNNVR
jgi:hypothetical protein